MIQISIQQLAGIAFGLGLVIGMICGFFMACGDAKEGEL